MYIIISVKHLNICECSSQYFSSLENIILSRALCISDIEGELTVLHIML